MPYVMRDKNNRVIAVYAEASEEATEWLDGDSPELRLFLTHIESGIMPEALDRLIGSDQALIRVLEDLVETLTAKNLMRFTDLPEAAQQKLLQRRTLRESINSLNLLGDDEQSLI